MWLRVGTLELSERTHYCGWVQKSAKLAPSGAISSTVSAKLNRETVLQTMPKWADFKGRRRAIYLSQHSL